MKCRDDLITPSDYCAICSRVELIWPCNAVCDLRLSCMLHFQLPILASELLKVLVIDWRDVRATEHADLKVLWSVCVRIWSFMGYVKACGLEIFQSLKDDTISSDVFSNCRSAMMIMGYKLERRSKVDAINVRMGDWRCATGEMDLLRTCFSCHQDDFSTGCSSHNAVIDEKDVAALEFQGLRVQFASNTSLARFLLRHDE